MENELKNFDQNLQEEAMRNAQNVMKSIPSRYPIGNDSEHLEQLRRDMDMANALYHEAKQYDTFEERWKKLGVRYQPLNMKNPALFMAAMHLMLFDDPEIKSYVKALEKSKGDAKMMAQLLREEDQKKEKMIQERIQIALDNQLRKDIERTSSNNKNI